MFAAIVTDCREKRGMSPSAPLNILWMSSGSNWSCRWRDQIFPFTLIKPHSSLHHLTLTSVASPVVSISLFMCQTASVCFVLAAKPAAVNTWSGDTADYFHSRLICQIFSWFNSSLKTGICHCDVFNELVLYVVGLALKWIQLIQTFISHDV